MAGLRKLAGGAAPLLVFAGVALLPRAERRQARPEPPQGARAGSPPKGDGSSQPAAAAETDGRGRHARSPSQIPLKGWKDILVRTKDEFGEDNVAMIAAGVTFYTLLALFPGLAALLGVYGLFSDPADVQRHIQTLSHVLPGGALEVIGGQLESLVRTNPAGLSASFVIGLLVALWSANGAVKALMVGLNVAYDEHETRGLVKRTVISLGFTAGFLAFAAASVAAMGLGPWIEARAGTPAAWAVEGVVDIVLVLMLGLGLSLVYRFGPSRDPVRFQWISWGSALTVVVWLAMSTAFTTYVANFGHFNKVYGSLGAVVGFMTWIYLSAMVILAGAELNAEIEHQTLEDTTEGAPRPLGARDASMADTVGRAT